MIIMHAIRSLEIHRKVERSKKGAQELNADKYQLKDAMKSATASNAKVHNRFVCDIVLLVIGRYVVDVRHHS